MYGVAALQLMAGGMILIVMAMERVQGKAILVPLGEDYHDSLANATTRFALLVLLFGARIAWFVAVWKCAIPGILAKWSPIHVFALARAGLLGIWCFFPFPHFYGFDIPDPQAITLLLGLGCVASLTGAYLDYALTRRLATLIPEMPSPIFSKITLGLTIALWLGVGCIWPPMLALALAAAAATNWFLASGLRRFLNATSDEKGDLAPGKPEN